MPRIFGGIFGQILMPADTGYVLNQDRCERCGKYVDTIHLDRHKKGKECQFRTAIEEQKLMGRHAVSRQLRGILDDFKIPYLTLTYHNEKRLSLPFAEAMAIRASGVDEMPVLFVEGRAGILARGLKARPLRWVLKRIAIDPEFNDAMESIYIMEGDLATVQFAGSQWQHRKGSHKNKKVKDARAKT